MRRFKQVLVRLLPGQFLGRSVPSRWVGFSLRNLHRLPRENVTRSRRYTCKFVLGNATPLSRVPTTRSCRTVWLTKYGHFTFLVSKRTLAYRRSCGLWIQHWNKGAFHTTRISSMDSIRAWATLTSLVSWKKSINSFAIDLQHTTPSLTETVALYNTRGIFIQWPFTIFTTQSVDQTRLCDTWG
jgi:hypothetical protein